MNPGMLGYSAERLRPMTGQLTRDICGMSGGSLTRILQLTSVLRSVGGIESCVRKLSDALVERGFDNLVIVPAVGQLPSPAPTKWRAVAVPFDEPADLLAKVAEYHPDIVVMHQLGRPSLSDALSRQYRTVEVIHTAICSGGKLFRAHDSLCEHALGRRCLIDWYAGPCGTTANPFVARRALQDARAQRSSLRRREHILVGSEYMRHYLVGEGIDQGSISVVDLFESEDRDRGAAVYREAKQNSDSYQLLYVGRVTYNKGLQYLLRALQLAHQSR